MRDSAHETDEQLPGLSGKDGGGAVDDRRRGLGASRHVACSAGLGRAKAGGRVLGSGSSGEGAHGSAIVSWIKVLTVVDGLWIINSSVAISLWFVVLVLVLVLVWEVGVLYVLISTLDGSR